MHEEEASGASEAGTFSCRRWDTMGLFGRGLPVHPQRD